MPRTRALSSLHMRCVVLFAATVWPTLAEGTVSHTRQLWQESSQQRSARTSHGAATALRACLATLSRHRTALMECSAAASTGVSSATMLRGRPPCHCFCPTCAPKPAVDEANLPPCPSSEPAYPLPPMMPAMPLRRLRRLPKRTMEGVFPAVTTEEPLFPSPEVEDDAPEPAAAAATLLQRSQQQDQLRQCRRSEREQAALLQQRGCLSRGAGRQVPTLPPAPTRPPRWWVWKGLQPRPGEGPPTSECVCHCPSCDSMQPAVPTCRQDVPPAPTVAPPPEPYDHAAAMAAAAAGQPPPPEPPDIRDTYAPQPDLPPVGEEYLPTLAPVIPEEE